MNHLLTAATTLRPHEKPKFRLRVLLVLLACLIGAGLISRFVLIDNSLRLDEAQSLWQTSHSIRGTLYVVALDVHVPLYHMLLHFWQLYFGNGVQTARLMSLALFGINIPVFYLLARRILSVNWALFAVVAFSFSPFMNWYANEARMYTLLALVATLSQYYFIRIIQRQKGWIGYMLTAIIGAYCHYFFFFNLAIQGLFFLANRRRFAKGSFLRFVGVALLAIAAIAPWLIYFQSLGAGKNTSPHLVRPSSVDFFNAFSQFGFGFQNDRINTILVSLWPILVIVALLAVRRKQKLSLTMSYVLSASLLPVILAYVLSFVVKPFFISRYMISCMAPLIILVVWFISNYRKKMAVIVATLLLMVTSLTSINQARDATTPVKEDYRQIAAKISAEASSSDEVVISSPFTVYPFEYYYHGLAQIQTLPEWDRRSSGAIPGFNPKTFPGQVTELNRSHRYVYLVLSYNQGYEKTILDYYNKHFYRLSAKTYSHDLGLYVYQVGYNNSTSLSKLPADMLVKPTTSSGTAVGTTTP